IGFPMAPSVGTIISQSRLKIHRPLWCWLGWGVRRGMEESEVIAGAGTRRDRVERTLLSAAFDVGFDLAVAFCGHWEDQKQHQGQERRTGVSALHSPQPLLSRMLESLLWCPEPMLPDIDKLLELQAAD